MEKLGPLPPAWNAQWDEMVAEGKDRERESTSAPVLGYKVHVADMYPQL